MFENEDQLTIIENTDQARKEYGYRYGASTLILNHEHMKALLEGKCLASNDGEYSTFLILDKEEK
jgi:hypothetical protein